MKSIYYGWFILIGAVLLVAYHSITFVYGITSFVTPIAKSLGWTYAMISLATTIRGFEIGAVNTVAGVAIDRWSARRLMILATVVYAAGVVLISQASSLLTFYLGYLLTGIGGTFCFSLIPQTVLARWFKKNIGKVSSVVAMGYSIGGLFTPVVVRLVDSYGWRDVMLFMGFGALVLGLMLFMLFKDRPEDYGFQVDGARERSSVSESAKSFKEVMRDRTFWLIGLAGTLQMLVVQALTIHIVPCFTNLGLTRPDAAIVVMVVSIIALCMRLVYGFMADVMPKKYVYAFSTIVTTIALVMLGSLNSPSYSVVMTFGVVWAIAIAGAMTMRVPIARDYYGAKNFGSVYGWLSVMIVAGSTIGAPFAGFVFDTQKSYATIWFIFAGLTAAATLMLLCLPKPTNVQAVKLTSQRE